MNIPGGPSLRMDDTLPLLPRRLAALDRRPTLMRFREPFSSFSSSFLGGMFSLPRPPRLAPRDSKSSSPSPLPLLGPPLPPATAALSCAGEAMAGVDCVRVNVPTRLLLLDEVLGGPSAEPRLGVLSPPSVPARRVGRNIEFDRVSGGWGVTVVAERVRMGRGGVDGGWVGCVEIDEVAA